MNELELALDLIRKVHNDGSDNPYYFHLIRVMIRLGETATLEEKTAALLHDVIEDTEMTIDDLKKIGFSDITIEMIKLCSKNLYPNHTQKEWTDLICNTQYRGAIKIKAVDTADNISKERMLFFTPKNNVSTKNTIKSVPTEIQLRIRKITDKSSKKLRRYSIYQRYFYNLNKFTEALTKEELNNINIGSFGSLYEINTLKSILTKEEYNNYNKVFNMGDMRIKGKIELINNSYLGVNINKDYINDYYNVFEMYCNKNNINYEEITQNQKNRDRNKLHITVISPIEYSKHKNNINFDTIINKEVDIVLRGIGSNCNNKDKCYYIISDSGDIDNIRKNFNLQYKDLHCTIAFDKKDVHGVSKNKDTEIISSNIIKKDISIKLKVK